MEHEAAKNLIILILSVFLVILPVYAQDSTYVVWESPKQISLNQGAVAIPHVVAKSNNVFLMWVIQTSSFSVFSQSSDHGLTWSTPRILPDT